MVKLPHEYVEGDTGPDLYCFDDTGTDLTGYTITMTIQRPGGTARWVTIAATEVDYSLGRWIFSFTSTDLIEGLNQLCTITILDPGLAVFSTENFLLDVRAA